MSSQWLSPIMALTFTNQIEVISEPAVFRFQIFRLRNSKTINRKKEREHLSENLRPKRV